MSRVSSLRIAAPALFLSVVAIGSTVVGVSGASTPPAVAAAGPAKTVTGALITRTPGTLAPGTKVRSSAVGQRSFTDSKHGFALASVGSAQYPAATTDAGRTWRTDGPALHLNAAQAPLVVLDLGAGNRKTIFAYGGGQVIDATGDGGKHWYRALFQGLPMAVVRNPRGHLVGFIDGGFGTKGPTLQYVSKNGGRTWRYDTTVGES
jgi:photosystem II stability/assembly factor-like uncharacterized protein